MKLENEEVIITLDDDDNDDDDDNSSDKLEFVVDRILSRRLLAGKVNSCSPEDYEYLVHWEGYDHSEDTWEPYNHLLGCPNKMKDFNDRLRTRALRQRKGKH